MCKDKGKIYLMIFLVLLLFLLLVIGLYIFAICKKNIIDYGVDKTINSKQISIKPQSAHLENIKFPSPVVSPSNRPQAKPKENIILLNNQKINLNQEFEISSDKRCTSAIKANISNISKDFIVLHQDKFLSNLGGFKWVDIPQEEKKLKVKNGDCIYARGLCMGGGGYKYCFTFNKVDNIYNINYQTKYFPNPTSPYKNPPDNL